MEGDNEAYEKRLSQLKLRLYASPLTTPENKKAIIDFVRSCKAEGLSANRTLTILYRLKTIIELVPKKDFRAFTRKDIEKVLIEVGKTKSAWNKWTYVSVIKKFWRWLYGLSSQDRAPDCVAWIKKETPPNKVRKEDLITPQEFRAMLREARTLLAKAVIAFLYETGARPGELRSARLSDVSVKDGYIKVYVTGKMAKKQGRRAVYIVRNYDILKAWLDTHPLKSQDAYLFMTKSRGKYVPLGYESLKKILIRAAKKAGIEKRVYPYLLRHTAGTRFYGKYGTVYARRLMGHEAGSSMEKVYCHLAEEDVEAVVLGVKPKEHDEDEMETARKLEAVDRIMDMLADNPEFIRLVDEAVKRINGEV